MILCNNVGATVLQFDQVRMGGNTVPTGNGPDAVSMNVPGGQFTYGKQGEGFTPNQHRHQ